VKIKRLKNHVLFSFVLFLLFSCTKTIKKEKKEQNEFFDVAYEYLDKGKSDSAFLYFNKAKDLFLQQKDSLGAGKCLVNMGIISNDKGDYFGAQEISLQAIPFFDSSQKRQHVYISSNLNNLAMVTHKLDVFQQALEFYDSAISLSPDSSETRILLNNKALTYQKLKDYKAALKIYEEILKVPGLARRDFARMLTNQAYTKWLQDPQYNPISDYLKALQIRQQEKDLWGQNSSYTHLAEYYATKKLDVALSYADKRYQVAKAINSADDRLAALQMLVQLSPPKESKIYFDSFYHLSDSLQTARSAAKNQFALIRYETEKHKADFLKAQTENIQKRNRIVLQSFALGVLVLLFILSYLWYRKRKKILQQEKELEVKNTELKYVKKIHDRVANKVYHVMSEVENRPVFDKEELLDKLEDLYNVSRDISYEKDLNPDEHYAEQLSEMLQSYSSSATEILIVSNEEELWEKVEGKCKIEVFDVLQELMTNMKKHSKADSVVLKFEKVDHCINILYADNGVGLNGSAKKNGLTNTENRIKSIRGTITFDRTVTKGLEINISFPIH